MVTMNTRFSGHESLIGNASTTTFVGRRRELTEARAVLANARLTTLTGPGGVGKTRLAVELARRSGRGTRDGVWLVDLSSLAPRAAVASAVATALSVRDQSNRSAVERVLSHVRDKQLLLVLDNCEHVLDSCTDLLGTLLPAAPGLSVLTTSREPLGMTGEHVYPVPPLALPEAHHQGTAQQFEQCESVSLLLDRARSVVGDFEVTDRNRHEIAELCTRLDGMPLAIELAAVRLRSLSVPQLLDRLDHRFDLLSRGDRTAQPRHRTLQALIDWSYDLCTPHEQLLWQRLSVFPGSFDLDAAEQVCGYGDLLPHTVLDVLDRLVAKSILLTNRTVRTVRYRQLMTVREYGAERLEASAVGGLRRRHRDHYLSQAETVVAQWCGPRQGEFIAQARVERPNQLSALHWSVSTPGQLIPATRLASSLRYHWISDGYLSDGRIWLDRVLDHPDAADSPERCTALWVVGWVALLQGDHDEGAAYLTECRQLATGLGDPALVAQAQHWTGLHQLFVGKLPEAIELYRAAVAGHRAAGDTASSLIAQFQLGMAQVFHGDPRIALATCEEALAIAREHGELWTYAYSQWITGICHWMLGDYNTAHTAATEALSIQADFQDAICTALTIELLSWIAASLERFRRARDLSDVAASVWRGLGTSISAFGPHITAISTASAKRVTHGLADDPEASRPYEGRNLSKEEAIEIALATHTPERTGPEHPLTPTELRIAQLIGAGLTNKQAAQQLVVSPRTVEGHVGRILAKLQFTSRAQIASWIQGLGA